MSYIPSYDLPEMFNELIVLKDYKKAIALLDEIFEMFPIEEDSIPVVILQGLLESATEESHINFIKYLLKHLEILYSNWLLNTA